MRLASLGVHQRTAPVEVRERLAFDPATLDDALAALREKTEEAFILATCNRVELYAVTTDDVDGCAILTNFLSDWHGVPAIGIVEHLACRTGVDAAYHLFRLTAGLDSMVLGEDQIVLQIKEAAERAQAAGAMGQVLHRLVDGALAAGKRVRTSTGIARSHLSVVSVALDLARAAPGGLRGRRILVLGAGHTAELAMKHLRKDGASVTILNRTMARAQALGQRFRATCRPLEELGAALAEADVVVSATAAPNALVTGDLVRAVGVGPEHPVLFLDLAIPRDVEPVVAEIPGARVVGVDDLRPLCDANRLARQDEAIAAELLVREELSRFEAWLAARRAVPTIQAIRTRAEEIRVAEMNKALARMPDLSDRERQVVEALSTAIVNKLLHDPIVALKGPSLDGQLHDIARQLFGIDDRAPASRRRASRREPPAANAMDVETSIARAALPATDTIPISALIGEEPLYAVER